MMAFKKLEYFLVFYFLFISKVKLIFFTKSEKRKLKEELLNIFGLNSGYNICAYHLIVKEFRLISFAQTICNKIAFKKKEMYFFNLLI